MRITAKNFCFMAAFVLTFESYAQAQSDSFIPLAVTEPRNAAVGFALTQAQFVNTLLGTCARLDEGMSESSKLTWSNWQARNWSHVEAARGWLQYVRALISSKNGQEAGASFQSKTIAEIGANARTTLLDIFPGGEPQAAACNQWLGLLSDPRIDLRASKEFGRDLDDILAFHRAVTEHAKSR